MSILLRSSSVVAVTMLLTACSKPIPVTVPFELSYQSQPLSCEHPINNLELKDFRFFIHQIQWQNSAGQWQPMTLNSDNSWQFEDIALLDFEDAKAGCEHGNALVNQKITGTLPAGEYQSLRFTLGVPFDRNHQNPLIARAPLNESSMHWHWQSGYKFIRAEFNFNGVSRRVHLGSLQCKGELDNITHCEVPNRPQITLTDITPDNPKIQIDLDPLFSNIAKEDTSKATCMGSSEHTWCSKAMNWLGLENDSQRAFRVAGK